MKISLVDVDGHNYPNLALCKIAGYHKSIGDSVDWYQPIFSHPDKIYASKVFTFTKDYDEYAQSDPLPTKGGTGYRMYENLPPEIEQATPDFTIYPDSIMRNKTTKRLKAFGFLTRGCIRNCPWCIVPRKEGYIKPVDDIVNIAQDRKEIVLMDNNFLSAPETFVTEQLEKIIRLRVWIEFNQALDCRLVTPHNAKLLAKCRWIQHINFACDTPQMVEPLTRAVNLIRENGFGGKFSVYMLFNEDLIEAEDRLHKLLALNVRPFAQAFRDFNQADTRTRAQKDFAAFVNVKGAKLPRTIKFKDYQH